jgi:hypothetical protein
MRTTTMQGHLAIYPELRTMNEVAAHVFPWTELVGVVLSVSFGAWAWIVKKFGEQHIESVKGLATELREMRRELNQLAERMKVVEVIQKHYHPHNEL